jgi:hypothetical protein
MGSSVRFYSSQLRDSCPAGYDGYAQLSAPNGSIAIEGIGPEDTLYRYTPNPSYIGLDLFNYTIVTNTGSTFGTGTVNVTVQPVHN